MKSIITILGVVFGWILAYAAPSAADTRILSEIRGHYKSVAELHENLKQQQPVHDASQDPSPMRLQEFIKQQAMLQTRFSPTPRRETNSGAAMSWTRHERLNHTPSPLLAARVFNNGPESAVVPFSGEFTDKATDIILPQRGGLRFAFERNYSSLSQADYGLGIGWDYNFNSSIQELPDGQGLLMRWQGRNIGFKQVNGNWLPQAGEFFSIEMRDTRIFVLTPDLTRIEFSPAQDKSEQEWKRWRLSAIATRHDSWRANRLEVDYLTGCDRIRHITDPYGQKISFAYDKQGHIIQVATAHYFVEFAYDADGFLTEAIYPDQFLDISRKVAKRTTYEYQKIGEHRMMSQKSGAGIPYALRVEYNDAAHVSKCGYFSADAQQVWQYEYRPNAVIVTSPAPTPATHYQFGNPLHPSLPLTVSVPAQNATWSYQYAENLLLCQEINPLEVKTVYRYDLANADPRFRGNMLSREVFPAKARPAHWQKNGTEVQYHSEIAAPVSQIIYQINPDGSRTVIKKDQFEYSAGNFMPTKQDSHGIVTRFAYNRYGESAMEIDANDNVTIYQYSEKLPVKSDYTFVQGTASGGGVLVSVIQDATSRQIHQACAELGVKPFLRNEITRIPPAALESKTAWDVYGNPICTQSGFSQNFSIFSPDGKALATYDSASGMSIYSYSALGKATHVKHEFCPLEDAIFRGEISPYFKGDYFGESFSYNTLGQMVTRTPTDEPAQTDGKSHSFIFERYSDGKLKSIVNPDGVKRVDIYDPQTGWLQARQLQGNSESLTLASEYRYYPNGSILSYKDQLGGVWEYQLDGFGDEYASVAPNKVVSKKKADAIGRILLQTQEDATGVIAKREYSYFQENGLLESVTAWRIAPGINEPVMMEQYKYDSAGNPIAKRGAQNGSWSYSLLDGMYRQVGVRNPAGDLNLTVFEQDIPVYSSSLLYEHHNKYRQTGTFRVVDHVGRPLQTILVDGARKLVRERASKNSYNAIGQLCESESTGLSKQIFLYDTLGNTLSEKTFPASSSLGEVPLTTSYVHSPGGSLLKQSVANTPLLLRGQSNDVTPELVEAPQITEYKFDEFGREVEMIQPDGLTIRKKYNEFSLPKFMLWTHVAEPDKELRSLELNYSNLGQVTAIKDKMAGNHLRIYFYDSLGNCIRTEDSSSVNPVILERAFDSLGLQLKESVSWNQKAFPVQLFQHDLIRGESSYTWDGLVPASLENWKSVFVNTDSSGRVSSLGLQQQEDIYARWSYIGDLTAERQISESGVTALYSYNELNEPVKTIFNATSGSKQRLGLLEYDYGPQGQAEFSSTRLTENNGKEYAFAMYAQFDSFRRLVAQNGEVKIPNTSDYRKRSRELFGTSDKSLAVLNTSRMQYDQNNNIWVNYSGMLPERFSPEAIKKHQSPSFSSSALPISSKSHSLSDLLLRELASNREASKASFSGDGEKLKAEEFIYDRLGNLTSFDGHFWNGHIQCPVKWKLDYDVLGRLVKMNAVAREDVGRIRKDTVAAELKFVYDSENRRICKTVTNYFISTDGVTNNTYTLFDGNNQSLVFSDKGRDFILTEQYLWRPGSRELLMAALPMRYAENADNNKNCRYFFQQDRGLNVVFSSRMERGLVMPVSAMSYMGFGENATFERIKSIRSSMGGANEENAYNQDLDDRLSGSWANIPGKPQFMELELEKEADIAQLTIWAADKFPEDFLVYVLPRGESSPYTGNIDQWTLEKKEFLAAVVKNGTFQNTKKENSLSSPYKLFLGERHGDRIIIAWDNHPRTDIEVREFEVTRTPDNPGAIAFAGQWLDRETNMYYQINRYRLAGSDKFISPDPIGFLDGANLYAYSHGNPLEWHDPDGRFAHILWGAGLGAAFGGGSYALNCWFSGAEFSWAQFGIQTFIGAASGTMAAATFGAGGFLGGGGWLASIGNGMLSGGVGGLTAGGLDAGISGAMSGQSALDMMDSIGWGMLKGGFTGMIAGGVGGGAVKLASIPRNLPRFIVRLVPTTKDSLRITRGVFTAGFAGMSGGAAGGTVSGAFEGFETGDYGFIGQRMWQGAAWGTGGALVAQGLMVGYERNQNVTWDKNRSRYWKNEATSNPQNYSPENLVRMQRGGAPQRINPQTGVLESMELHHNVITRRTGLPRTLVDQKWNLKKVWPDEHRTIDPFRK